MTNKIEVTEVSASKTGEETKAILQVTIDTINAAGGSIVGFSQSENDSKYMLCYVFIYTTP